ncbi:uncharacterized protein [Ptychodera flava]|uniref:uncharacterized protein n=1 Tax=Ptychodera flava TaxID=63121 RepID=UPI003969E4AD
MGNLWQLFIRGVGNELKIIEIHKDATVDDLLRMISEWNEIPAETQRILYVGKQLEYGKGMHLSDYNIENNSNLYVVLRLKGGSNEGAKQLDDSVELTDAPDMITWDDDPENKRAKMPCGHAIGPESLTAYCRSLLSSGKFRFLCPYISSDSTVYCGKEWQYVDVRRLAVLTDAEKKEFEMKITNNYLRKAQGIQECPQCKSLCEREDRKSRRVICPLCTHENGGTLFEFCWCCLHDWRTNNTTNCGNTACNGEDPRLKILRECPKKEVIGVLCPSRRACPTCGSLIEHETACKQMICPCGQKFCFICLKKADRDEYKCGSWNTKCTVADIQTKIPGAE